MTQNNGGPAFPTGAYGLGGIYVRDYFAAAALQGILSNPYTMKIVMGTLDGFNADADQIKMGKWIETQAWKYADVMLKSREAGQ